MRTLASSAPIRRQQIGFYGDGVNVIRQRERDHVGFQAVNDSPRLLARTAMRLLNFYRLSGLRFPVLGKRGVVVLIKFSGRIVGYVQQRDGTLRQAQSG
jgi:hypothetical protein